MSDEERSLKRLRKRVDRADRQLLEALAARLETVRVIGRVKIAAGMPIFQKKRMTVALKEWRRIAGQLGLRQALTQALYGLVHREALRIQKKLPRVKKR